MKLSVPSGTTSKRIAIFIQDSSSTSGAGLTGLVFNSASLTCYSWIDTDGNAGGTAQALQTATLGTWTTRGFKEKDATNMPGWYEFGVPDALLAAGVKWATLHFKGATNMAPLPIEIEVTATSNQDAVRAGLTALPNANAEAAGGLFTRGTGAGQINQEANGYISINLKAILGTVLTETAGQIAGAFKKFFDKAAPTGTVNSIPDAVAGAASGIAIVGSNMGTTTSLTGDAFARLGAPAGASVSADVATVKTDTAAIKVRTDLSPEGFKKNTAQTNFEFFMADSADHVSGKTGLTVAVARSIDGGAFAASTNTPATEVANGMYKIDLSAADLNGTIITFKMTAAGADATLITIKTSL